MLACGFISMGKGVCGTAASVRKTQVIKDVKALENYIACDEETRSEIVVPVFLPAASSGSDGAGAAKGSATGGGDVAAAAGGEESAAEQEWKEGERLCAVLDIDGEEVGAFTEVDAFYLKAICREFITAWASTAAAGSGAAAGYSAL